MKTCRDVMTENPTTCLPSDTVSKVARIMKSEDVGPVPVVESMESKKLVGIVTDRDITIKVVAEGRDPQNTRIEKVMTKNPVTCRPGDDIHMCERAMSEHQVRRIPIVDNDGHLLGIVAQADIATRQQAPEEVGKVVEQISQPAA